MVPRVVQARRVDLDRAAGRIPEQEAGDVLPVLAARVVLLPRKRAAPGALVLAGHPPRIRAELVVQAHVIAGPQGVGAHQPRVGRLERVDRVRRVPGEVIADVAQRVEVEQREISRAAEERRHARRETERRGIEVAFVLPYVRLLEPLPAGSDIPQRAVALRPRVVVGDAVVLAEQVVAGRDDPVDLAEDGVARLAAIVAGVAHERPLPGADVVIDAGRDRVEVVAAGIAVEEIVQAALIRRLVGQRIVAQDLLRDRIEPVGRDVVARKRLPHHTGADGLRGQRIVDLDSLREQCREVAVPHGFRRHGLRQRLREFVVQPLRGAEPERAIVTVVQSGDDDRPADREARPLVRDLRLRRPVLLHEEIGFRELVGAVVGVRGAGQPVRAPLQRHVDGRARGVAVRRVEARGLDLELLHGPGRGDERDAPSVRHVRRSVQRELIAARGAFRRDARRAGVVERPRELEVARERDARHEPREHERVAVRERHHLDPLLVDHLPLGGRSHLEQRRLRGDEHGLLELSDLEVHVHDEAVADAHVEPFTLRYLDQRRRWSGSKARSRQDRGGTPSRPSGRCRARAAATACRRRAPRSPGVPAS